MSEYSPILPFSYILSCVVAVRISSSVLYLCSIPLLCVLRFPVLKSELIIVKHLYVAAAMTMAGCLNLEVLV